MKKTYTLILMLAVLALGACSYFDTEETIEVDSPDQPQKIDLMTKDGFSENTANQFLDGFSAPVQQNAENLPASPAASLNASGVEIYPLDDDMMRLTPAQNMAGGQKKIARPVDGPQTVYEGSVNSGNAVYFEYGDSELDAIDRETIAQIARNHTGRLSVEGHASSENDAPNEQERKMLNLRMSMKRAYSVVKELVANGVAPERIRTVAWGETQQPADNAAENARRVEILKQ